MSVLNGDLCGDLTSWPINCCAKSDTEKLPKKCGGVIYIETKTNIPSAQINANDDAICKMWLVFFLLFYNCGGEWLRAWCFDFIESINFKLIN